MSRKWKRIRQAVLALAGALLATSAHPALTAAAAASEASPLAMEELEVRGVRERPDQLYVPAPMRLFRPAPIRYDLFTEELATPIPACEIQDGQSINGGVR